MIVTINTENKQLKSIFISENGQDKFGSAFSVFQPEPKNEEASYKLDVLDSKLLYSYGKKTNGHFIERSQEGFLIGKTEMGVLKNFVQLNDKGEVIDLENSFKDNSNSILSVILNRIEIKNI